MTALLVAMFTIAVGTPDPPTVEPIYPHPAGSADEDL